MRLSDLDAVVRQGIATVERGGCYFIDVRIVPDYKGFPH
jgi:hypothetical protein